MVTDDPGFRIAGHGVNAVGHESGNAAMCAGRVLAWLQDQPADNVWGDWAVTQRDCVILDPLGRVFAIYNLTTHDLSVPTNYAELKALFLAAAAAPP
jgi:hypothetical protein